VDALPPWFVGRVDVLPPSSLEILCILDVGVSFQQVQLLGRV
jgi:hypothetical protein